MSQIMDVTAVLLITCSKSLLVDVELLFSIESASPSPPPPQMPAMVTPFVVTLG